MVTFRPAGPGGLAGADTFERGIGGAETNVLCGLAAAGHRVKWVSRVGADGFGTHLLDRVAAHGVDTTDVARDPARPTGIYFRTAGERAVTDAPCAPAEAPLSEVAYYRAGSAASAMSPATVPLAAARSGRLLHLTGITAALSQDCLALLRALLAPAPATGTGTDTGTGSDTAPDAGSAAHRPLVSFDLNYRVSLWPGPAAAAPVLFGLARAADTVFVGDDEAAALGVTGGPAAVRAALPEPPLLVVKQGAAGATAFHRGPGGTDTVTAVPAPRVDVVAPVGAGDAFAAGFLSATLRGLPLRLRLRHGHLAAAAALTVPGDLPEPPVRARSEEADRLAALDDAAWGRLRIGPGGARPPRPGAQEEVATP
ncbi:sugar kinase [Streptomyces sp. NPDC050560]|uniref:sugar kinase n=1 Tax=Streptomyces sp. NPDC050560 TaxID=3365630 RepID=UPI0037B72C5F